MPRISPRQRSLPLLGLSLLLLPGCFLVVGQQQWDGLHDESHHRHCMGRGKDETELTDREFRRIDELQARLTSLEEQVARLQP